MILATERLRLEPLQASDSAAMFRLLSNADVMVHWDVAEINDPDIVDQVVAGQVEEMGRGRAWYWAMRSLMDGGFVGCCDLSGVDRLHHRGEVGFMLAPQAWGRGYAREAMVAVIAFAAELGLRRLSARTHVGNQRSEHLLTRLGFEDEGMLRCYVQRDGERRDCRLWGLLL